MERFGVVVTMLLVVASVQAVDEWTEWSDCSEECGGGLQDKTRTCDESSCGDNFYESRPCNTQTCPWGDWNEWSDCSTSCNGQRERSRECPSGNCEAEDDGKELKYSESGECSSEDCDEIQDGEYTDWEEWGACTSSCGQGTQQRVRKCDSGSCTAQLHENRDCQGEECEEWEWEEWSECTASCGGGEQKRNSVCSGESCGGQAAAQETQDCNTEQCEWQDWGAWSDCSEMCGPRGKTRRERSCPEGDCGQGDTYEEKTCLIEEICVWGEWSEWSDCGVCLGGSTERERSCANGDCGGENGKQEEICPDAEWEIGFSGDAISTSTEAEAEDTDKDNLIDDDENTCWKSLRKSVDVERSITVDLGASRRILGVKVTLANKKGNQAILRAEVWVGGNLCGQIQNGEKNYKTFTVKCDEGCGYEGSEVMIKVDPSVNGRMKFCKIKILGGAESEPEL